MSILLDPPNLTRRTTPGKAGLWLALGVVVWLGLSAVAATQLIPLTLNAEADNLWLTLLGSAGTPMVVRRIQVGVLIFLCPIFLKRLSWSGFREVGWTSKQTRGERKRDALVWSLAGIAISIGLGIWLVTLGEAEWVSMGFLKTLAWLVKDVLLFGILGIIVVETFCRGILYRTLADQWSSWASALLVSFLVAWFRLPATASIDVDDGVLSVVASVLFSPVSSWPHVQLFFTSFLLQIILCRFVHHKGDIWGAVGLHASLWIGLDLFVLTGDRTGSTRPQELQQGFYAFSQATPGFLFGLLLFWGWVEWRHRKKLTSYGRVHF